VNGPRRPNRNDWFSPATILTVVAMGMTAYAAYSTFNQNIDKRVSVLETQVAPMWRAYEAARQH